MDKRVVISVISFTLVFVFVFAACNKMIYTDPTTDKKYYLVTDDAGNIVYNYDGELLAYVTNENGRIVKDDDGNPETEVNGFIGQIELKGKVIDYAYIVNLPSGWKTGDDFGIFCNSSKSEKMTIEIVKYTYEDYYNVNKSMCNAIEESAKKGEITAEVNWEDKFDYKAADTQADVFTIKSTDDDGKTKYSICMFFENNGNVYRFVFESDTSDNAMEDCKAFCNSITFKPYTYYDDITSTSAESTESTTEATTS